MYGRFNDFVYDAEKGTIEVACIDCGAKVTIPCTPAQHAMLCGGNALIQDIFPDVSPADRELFVSGLCDACWNCFTCDDGPEDDEFADQQVLSDFIEDRTGGMDIERAYDRLSIVLQDVHEYEGLLYSKAIDKDDVHDFLDAVDACYVRADGAERLDALCVIGLLKMYSTGRMAEILAGCGWVTEEGIGMAVVAWDTLRERAMEIGQAHDW